MCGRQTSKIPSYPLTPPRDPYLLLFTPLYNSLLLRVEPKDWLLISRIQQKWWDVTSVIKLTNGCDFHVQDGQSSKGLCKTTEDICSEHKVQDKRYLLGLFLEGCTIYPEWKMSGSPNPTQRWPPLELFPSLLTLLIWKYIWMISKCRLRFPLSANSRWVALQICLASAFPLSLFSSHLVRACLRWYNSQE